ncbi:protein kinase [Motilimonas sp. KMU-193]|uniref:protein kinase n=1 Tax=Motilimonas sp. KMU-193 TaxID=3388668 RepID=UPI00396B1F80
MHTLAQLKSGQLTGCKRLQLAEGLTEFPSEIFTLADSLEILDLSNNQLSSLPDDLHQLHQLKIIFASNNCFDHLPEVLGQCPKLEMIGFKSNQIKQVSGASLPLQTRWLILTDNQIEQLPERMGEMYRLQKLALAGNQLTELPASMANCNNLELVRLSANRLSAIPNWLLTLPKLAWLAFSGNPFSHVEHCQSATIPSISSSQYQLGEVLGQGASGVIYRAQLNHQQTAQDVAIKVFKGGLTSDGYPSDELDCCLTTSSHPNLIKVLAQVDEADQLALVMELIPTNFTNLGLPPSLQSCTRDTFADGTQFTPTQIHLIAQQMADTLAHMHQQGVSHGDIYAHNILINEQNQVLFGDFGAATHLNHITPTQQAAMEAIEVRAFGCLLDDLLGLVTTDNPALTAKLREIVDLCFNEQIANRPSFKTLTGLLQL